MTLRTAAVDVVADPDHVRRILVNLLSNARRAAPAGPVVVTVDELAGQGRVVVADGGPGIAPADRERVFDRLVRLDPARAGDGGAGLGLSISRGLARAAGGELRCADPGGGRPAARAARWRTPRPHGPGRLRPAWKTLFPPLWTGPEGRKECFPRGTSTGR